MTAQLTSSLCSAFADFFFLRLIKEFKSVFPSSRPWLWEKGIKIPEDFWVHSMWKTSLLSSALFIPHPLSLHILSSFKLIFLICHPSVQLILLVLAQFNNLTWGYGCDHMLMFFFFFYIYDAAVFFLLSIPLIHCRLFFNSLHGILSAHCWPVALQSRILIMPLLFSSLGTGDFHFINKCCACRLISAHHQRERAPRSSAPSWCIVVLLLPSIDRFILDCWHYS